MSMSLWRGKEENNSNKSSEHKESTLAGREIIEWLHFAVI